MRLAKDYHLIQALAAQRADQTLSIAICHGEPGEPLLLDFFGPFVSG
jgi:hypothetical protein